MKKIAIIGGGIGGLSAAFYLEQARRSGADLDYTIFEKSDHFGGALLTEEIDGCIVEGGADSFLTEKPWAAELCRELGIEDQLIGSNDTERQTFIVHKKRLTPLPSGMNFFVPTDPKAIQQSKLFSAKAKKTILRETSFRPTGKSSRDISVGEFVERHFGIEMVERVADPLLAGIYGGDARQLSMQAVLPKFLDMEERCGSLIRAVREMKLAAGAPRPLFTSLKSGMRQLVRAVTAKLPAYALQTHAEVVGAKLNGDKWRLVSNGKQHDWDAVVVASPAYAAARLLSPISPILAKLLRRIAYSSSATVAFGFSEQAGSTLPELQGFGFLVPQKEGHRALACTFVHNKLPGRVPADRALLRIFFGGVHDDKVLQLKDGDLVSLARAELGALLKVKDEPLFARVHRWPRAMPQYNVGHKDLTQKIAQAVSELPGLVLAGNAYGGVGIPDCIRQGRDAARQLTGTTGNSAPAT